MSFEWHKESHLQWNSMSDRWQQNSEEMWERGSRKTILPLFTKHVDATGGAILDAGCGDGYGTWKLALLGFKVTGVDLSGEMIKKASSRTKEGLALQFMQADVIQLPFEDEKFAGILTINCLEWIEDPLQGLLELKRVLIPGGVACIGILGPTAAPRQHSFQRLYGRNVICNGMMPWEFARLAEENGFQIIDQEGVYKRGVSDRTVGALSLELRQALSFMWLFVLRKD